MSDNLSVFINPPWPPPFLHQPSHLWSWWWKPIPTPHQQRQSLTIALLCTFAKSDDQYIRPANMTCGMRTPDVCLQSRCCCGFPWTALCHQAVHKNIIFPTHHNTTASLCLCKTFCICGQVGWLVVIRHLCQTSPFWTIILFKRLFPWLSFFTPYL